MRLQILISDNYTLKARESASGDCELIDQLDELLNGDSEKDRDSAAIIMEQFADYATHGEFREGLSKPIGQGLFELKVGRIRIPWFRSKHEKGKTIILSKVFLKDDNQTRKHKLDYARQFKRDIEATGA